MPELPEVQTVVNGLKPAIENKRITQLLLRRPDLRFPFPKDLAKILEGDKVIQVSRRAKIVCIALEKNPDLLLLLHLGMSGQVLVFDPGKAPDSYHKHDHVLFDFEDRTQVRFRDPRRFGFLKLVDKPSFLASEHLGPEPFSDPFSASYLQQKFKGKNRSIKAMLLDQSIVAGLGNIYVLEALHMVGVHPERPCQHLNLTQCEQLIAAIKEVLQAAIISGGSSLKDHVQTNGEMGYFQHAFKVYGRAGETCLTCQKHTVERLKQHGRSSFFCPGCQL